MGTEWESCWVGEAFTRLFSWDLFTLLAPFNHPAEPDYLLAYSPDIRDGHKTTLAHPSLATRLVTSKVKFPWVSGSAPSDILEVHSTSRLEVRINKQSPREARTKAALGTSGTRWGSPLLKLYLPPHLCFSLQVSTRMLKPWLIAAHELTSSQLRHLKRNSSFPLGLIWKYPGKFLWWSKLGSYALSYELGCLSHLG